MGFGCFVITMITNENENMIYLDENLIKVQGGHLYALHEAAEFGLAAQPSLRSLPRRYDETGSFRHCFTSRNLSKFLPLSNESILGDILAEIYKHSYKPLQVVPRSLRISAKSDA